MTSPENAFPEETLKHFITRQLQHNSGKNIFYSGEENRLDFLDETCKLIECFQNLPSPNKKEIIDFTVDKALAEFYRINQYYRFDQNAQTGLKQVYLHLINDISGKKNVSEIAEAHYSRLQEWLRLSNPFAAGIYPEDLSVIDEVVCAEYSAEMQIEVFGIDPAVLNEPVLDLGCGIKALLVGHLAGAGFDVYGIDRNAPGGDRLSKTDWLDFNFGPGYWGTVISNLGFSNHFRHHHLRSDGDYLTYARKYMEILQSLKPGGSFYYAPDLPFIETYLDPAKYEVSRKEIPLTGYCSVRVERKR